MKFIQNFNREVIGERKKFRLSKKKVMIPFKNTNLNRKINDTINLVPSLRYKMYKIEQSQKKISEQKENQILKGNRISLHRQIK